MTRPTPHLDAVKAERDAALLRCAMAEREREEACTLLLAAQRELVPTIDALDQAREDLKSTRYQLADAKAALTAARKVNAFYAKQNAQLKQDLAAAHAALFARIEGDPS